MVIIGAGRLGRALAAWAPRGGYTLAAIVSRNARRARALARRLGASQGLGLGEEMPAAELYWLAVPDDALETTARRLAQTRADWRGRVVLHSSGQRDSSVLRALGRRGAQTGSLHPMMSFAAGMAAEPERVLFNFEGAARARRAARALIRRWRGEWLELPAAAKPACHLAATLAAPGLVTLMAAAQWAAGGGLPERKRAALRRGLLTLMNQTARNLSRPGARPADAWTGPLARGDRETLRQHLALAHKLAMDDFYRAQMRLAQRLLPTGNALQKRARRPRGKRAGKGLRPRAR